MMSTKVERVEGITIESLVQMKAGNNLTSQKARDLEVTMVVLIKGKRIALLIVTLKMTNTEKCYILKATN